MPGISELSPEGNSSVAVDGHSTGFGPCPSLAIHTGHLAPLYSLIFHLPHLSLPFSFTTTLTISFPFLAFPLTPSRVDLTVDHAPPVSVSAFLVAFPATPRSALDVNPLLKILDEFHIHTLLLFHSST